MHSGPAFHGGKNLVSGEIGKDKIAGLQKEEPLGKCRKIIIQNCDGLMKM